MRCARLCSATRKPRGCSPLAQAQFELASLAQRRLEVISFAGELNSQVAVRSKPVELSLAEGNTFKDNLH